MEISVRVPSIYVVNSQTLNQPTQVLVDRLESIGYRLVNDSREVLSAASDPNPEYRNVDSWVFVINEEFARSPQLMGAAGRVSGLSNDTGTPTVIVIVIDDQPVPPWTPKGAFVIRSSDWAIPDKAGDIVAYISSRIARRESQREERAEIRDRVDRQLEHHISPVLERLTSNQKQFRWAGMAFYGVALATLLLGLYFAYERAQKLRDAGVKTWFDVAAFAIGSFVVIGMLTAVARLAFLLGRSFMVESLTNGDRAHAISFGRFYLQAFGDRANWNEVKEAFEHWNTDRGSSFSSQTATDVDPVIMQVAVEAAKAFATKAK